MTEDDRSPDADEERESAEAAAKDAEKTRRKTAKRLRATNRMQAASLLINQKRD